MEHALHSPMSWRKALIVLGCCAIAAGLLLPADRWVMTTVGPYGGLAKGLGGDVKRELEFVQQFGAFTCTVILMIVVILNEGKERRRAIFDWLVGLGVNAVAYNAFKIALGRPRPRVSFGDVPPEYADTLRFAFFFREHPLPRNGTLMWAKSWEFGKGISSDLWSMPSSHTAAAFLLAAVLSRLYPSLSVLLIMIACLVGIARVVTGAHYPSDVVLGAGLGWVIGAAAMDHRWGRVFVRG